jgi:hypothetical protein
MKQQISVQAEHKASVGFRLLTKVNCKPRESVVIQ